MKIYNPVVFTETCEAWFGDKKYTCKTNVRRLDFLKEWDYTLRNGKLVRYEIKPFPKEYECVYCTHYKKYCGFEFCRCFIKNEIRSLKIIGGRQRSRTARAI